MRLLHGTAAWVVDRDGGSRPIDEQLLAGLVFLAQNYILPPAPALVQNTKTRVAIAIRVGLPVLFPRATAGSRVDDAAPASEGRRSLASPTRLDEPRRTAEQGSLQSAFVPIFAKRPRNSGSFGPLQILVNGSEANRTTAGDCPQPQTH
jgi:hypothetical protein